MNIAIRLNAGNDRNGNPRRCYVILDGNNDIIKVIDEGYTGYAAIKDYPDINPSNVPTIATSASEYRDLLKNYRKRG